VGLVFGEPDGERGPDVFVGVGSQGQAQRRRPGIDEADHRVRDLPRVVGQAEGAVGNRAAHLARLRSSGMPLPEIRRYAQLVVEGPGNETERFEILRRHEARVRQQVADLQETLGIIHAKVEIYARHLAAGTADQLWRDGPECD
jgi:hypothetical protein